MSNTANIKTRIWKNEHSTNWDAGVGKSFLIKKGLRVWFWYMKLKQSIDDFKVEETAEHKISENKDGYLQNMIKKLSLQLKK